MLVGAWATPAAVGGRDVVIELGAAGAKAGLFWRALQQSTRIGQLNHYGVVSFKLLTLDAPLENCMTPTYLVFLGSARDSLPPPSGSPRPASRACADVAASPSRGSSGAG